MANRRRRVMSRVTTGVDRGDWSVALAAAFSFARRRRWRLGRASGVVGSTSHIEVA